MRSYMPVEVFCEKGAVRLHGKEISSLGTKAMIVTGKSSSRKNGSLKDMEDVLKENGTAYVIFDDIEENPSVETVVKAAKIAVEEKVDFFVGIGGGSPMDASKAISLLAKNPDKIENAREVLYKPEKLEYYPLAEVPTTSGTGSEVTQYSILTLHDKDTKQGISHQVFARYALVDAGYLKTSSYTGMVNTCVDALAHMIESALCVRSSVFSRMYAYEGLRIWGTVKEYLLSETAYKTMPEEAYEKFMNASVLAGIAIAHTGTSIPHGLSYPVTYEMGVSHGKAVGIFLPAFIGTYDDRKAANEILALLGFSNADEFKTFIETILGKVDIPEALWKKDVEGILSNPAKLKSYPFEMTRKRLESFR